MSISVPPELSWLSTAVLGQQWPPDEDQMMARAAAWHDTHLALRQLDGHLDHITTALRNALRGGTAEQFTTFATHLDRHLPPLADSANALADYSRRTAVEIQYVKLMAIGQIAWLAGEITLAIQSAPWTAGASLATIPALITLTQLSIRTLLRQLLRSITLGILRGIAFQNILDGLIQSLQLLLKTRTEWDLTKTGFAAEIGALSGVFGGILGTTLTTLTPRFAHTWKGLITQGTINEITVDQTANAIHGGDPELGISVLSGFIGSLGARKALLPTPTPITIPDPLTTPTPDTPTPEHTKPDKPTTNSNSNTNNGTNNGSDILPPYSVIDPLAPAVDTAPPTATHTDRRVAAPSPTHAPSTMGDVSPTPAPDRHEAPADAPASNTPVTATPVASETAPVDEPDAVATAVRTHPQNSPATTPAVDPALAGDGAPAGWALVDRVLAADGQAAADGHFVGPQQWAQAPTNSHDAAGSGVSATAQAHVLAVGFGSIQSAIDAVLDPPPDSGSINETITHHQHMALLTTNEPRAQALASSRTIREHLGILAVDALGVSLPEATINHLQARLAAKDDAAVERAIRRLRFDALSLLALEEKVGNGILDRFAHVFDPAQNDTAPTPQDGNARAQAWRSPDLSSIAQLIAGIPDSARKRSNIELSVVADRGEGGADPGHVWFTVRLPIVAEGHDEVFYGRELSFGFQPVPADQPGHPAVPLLGVITAPDGHRARRKNTRSHTFQIPVAALERGLAYLRSAQNLRIPYTTHNGVEFVASFLRVMHVETHGVQLFPDGMIRTPSAVFDVIRELRRQRIGSVVDDLVKAKETGRTPPAVSVSGAHAQAFAGMLATHGIDATITAGRPGGGPIQVDWEHQRAHAPPPPAAPVPAKVSHAPIGPGAPRKTVLDDPSWLHSTAPRARWFDPKDPVSSQDIMKVRRRAPIAFTVRGEDRSVATDSTITPDGVDLSFFMSPIAYDVRTLEVKGVKVLDLTIKLHLVGRPGDVAAVQKRARAGVEELFNRGYRFPTGAQFHVTVEFTNEADAHSTIHLAAAGARANALSWPVDASPRTLAHEVGHHLGLRDEYLEKDVHPDKKTNKPIFQHNTGYFIPYGVVRNWRKHPNRVPRWRVVGTGSVVNDNAPMTQGLYADDASLKPRDLYLIEKRMNALASAPLHPEKVGSPEAGDSGAVGNDRADRGSGIDDAAPVVTLEYDFASDGEVAQFVRHVRTLEEAPGRFPSVLPVIRTHPGPPPPLEISADGTLAWPIDDGAARFKEFYATPEVIAEAQARLREVGSELELAVAFGSTVTYNGTTLLMVTPHFTSDPPSVDGEFSEHVSGGPHGHAVMRLPGETATSGKITKGERLPFHGTHELAHAIAAAALTNPAVITPQQASDAMAKQSADPPLVGAQYGTALVRGTEARTRLDRVTRQLGVNQFAWAEPGEAYLLQAIATRDASGANFAVNHARTASGQQLPAAWTHHTASVVANNAADDLQIAIQVVPAEHHYLLNQAINMNLANHGHHLQEIKQWLYDQPDKQDETELVDALIAIQQNLAHLHDPNVVDHDRGFAEHALALAEQAANAAITRITGPGMPPAGQMWFLSQYSRAAGHTFFDKWGNVDNPDPEAGMDFANPLVVVTSLGAHTRPDERAGHLSGATPSIDDVLNPSQPIEIDSDAAVA